MKMADLIELSLLGVGTFGRVRLVQHRTTKTPYALKIINKGHIVRMKQQTNLMNEKNAMLLCNHPFILKLVTTMKDAANVYMVLELCLGGELFSYLHSPPDREVDQIPEAHAQFYAGNVCCAFGHMHDRNILYRDLKPENLLIDETGYLKVVDFGFAKVVQEFTYTLCGTPEYLAPELVLGSGHGKGVDYWALGVLIYEMITGDSPFAANDPVQICKKVLAGKFKASRNSSPVCTEVIKELLTKESRKRLGCKKGGVHDIVNHRFFQGMDWNALLRRNTKAPWVPRIKNPLDTRNFECAEDEIDEQDMTCSSFDGSGWDHDF